MNIFDEVDENLFRPLTGINKRKYVDILTLIWDKCKRMPMYAIEKSTTFGLKLGLRLSEQAGVQARNKLGTSMNR